MMPMELYSTEMAYKIAHTEPCPCQVEDASSVGYYQVLVATALVTLVALLVDLVWKLMKSHPINMTSDIKMCSTPRIEKAMLRGTSPAGKTFEHIKILPSFSNHTLVQMQKWFPGAVVNQDLVKSIKESLEPYGYGESSLIATSLCCDEVNRPLEKELAGIYDHYFAMGGLAGVPFGGVTAFGAMAHHIPDGGSCLIVYGPHVGIDSQGNVGTVNRRGRIKGGACCGSAVAAASYVKGVLEDGKEQATAPDEPFDAQQTFVGNMLLPHGTRLLLAEEANAELPYAMYDAQTELIEKIVDKGCAHVAGDGKIALLGGIQINTPPGHARLLFAAAV